MVCAMLLIGHLINIPCKIIILDMHTPHLRVELSHVGMKGAELARHVFLTLPILAIHGSAEVSNLLVQRVEPLVHIIAQLRELCGILICQIGDVSVHGLHQFEHLLQSWLAGIGSPIRRRLGMMLLRQRHPKWINSWLCGRLGARVMRMLRL